jgi:hypothetical protein
MSRIRTIVRPTDFSRASRPAFKRAVEMAKDRRASCSSCTSWLQPCP